MSNYVYGKTDNDPIIELVACFDLIRMFIPNETNHPSCLKFRQDAKRLIKEINLKIMNEQ
jgi:hypothetical protein